MASLAIRWKTGRSTFARYQAPGVFVVGRRPSLRFDLVVIVSDLQLYRLKFLEIPWMERRTKYENFDADVSSYQQIAVTHLAGADVSRSPRVRSCGWRSLAAAAGTSLTIAGAADAEVQYFSPPSPIRLELLGVLPGSDLYSLDIDGDGQTDINFELLQTSVTEGSTQRTSRTATAHQAIADNAVIGSDNYAFNVFSGAVISQSRPQTSAGQIFGEFHSVTASSSVSRMSGEWGDEETGLLGAKFARAGVGGSTNHFAWIRVRTDFTQDSQALLEILNWAYDDVPGALIRAGDEVGQVELVGDYDDNHVVDLLDYSEWKDTYGRERIPGEAADGNGNGIVDTADYTIWRDVFNPVATASSGAAAAATVPEPSMLSLAVLALGSAGVMALRRHAHGNPPKKPS